MEKVPYREAIGSLMYLMVSTRPDLAYAVGLVGRYMEHPGIEHWQAVKWIFRYVCGTLDHGITLGSTNGNEELPGYSDSDWAGDLDERKWISGHIFFLGGTAVLWRSRKQKLFLSRVRRRSISQPAKPVVNFYG